MKRGSTTVKSKCFHSKLDKFPDLQAGCNGKQFVPVFLFHVNISHTCNPQSRFPIEVSSARARFSYFQRFGLLGEGGVIDNFSSLLICHRKLLLLRGVYQRTEISPGTSTVPVIINLSLYEAVWAARDCRNVRALPKRKWSKGSLRLFNLQSQGLLCVLIDKNDS